MECTKCLLKYNECERLPYSIYPCLHFTYCQICKDNLELKTCLECNKLIIGYKLNHALLTVINLLSNNNEKKSNKNEIQTYLDDYEKKLNDFNETVNEKTSNLKIQIHKETVQWTDKINSEKGHAIQRLDLIFDTFLSKLKDLKTDIDCFRKSIKNDDSVNLDQIKLKLNMKNIEKINHDFEVELNKVNIKFKFDFKVCLNNLAIQFYDDGVEFFYNSNFIQTIELMDKALALKSDYSEAYFLKGHAFFKLENYSKANELFDRSIECDQNNLLAIIYKGFNLEFLDKNEEAIQLFEKALEKNPNPRDAHDNFRRALALDGLKKHKDALKYFDKAIEIDQNNFDYYFNKAYSLSSLEMYNESNDNYNKAIKCKPNYYNTYYNIALNYKSIKQFDLSLANFSKSIQLYSQSYSSHVDKLDLLVILNKNYDVIEEADLVLKKFPKRSSANEYKIKALENLNKTETAIELCLDVLEKEKIISDVYYFCLKKIYDHKKYNEALIYSNKAFLIDSNNLEIVKIRIDCLCSLNKYDEALQFIEVMLALLTSETANQKLNYMKNSIITLKQCKISIKTIIDILENEIEFD